MQVDLNARLPQGSGLEGKLTWTLVEGVGEGASGATLTEGGLLSPQTGSGLQSVRTAFVWVTDAAGHSLPGQVKISYVSNAGSASLSVVPGQAGATVADLNASVYMMPGTPATRVWAFAAGQAVPDWLTLSPSGLVSLSPSAAVPKGSLEYYAEVIASQTNAGTGAKYYERVRVEVLDFAAALLRSSDAMGALTVDLAQFLPREAGLKEPVTWASLSPRGEMEGSYVVGGTGQLSVTASGTFMKEVLVSATDADGKKLRGSVFVSAIFPVFIGKLALTSGNTRPAGLDLNQNPGGMPLSGSFKTRTWKFVAGQTIPDWLTIDAFGRVSALPTSGITLLPSEYFVEMTDSSMAAMAGTEGKSYGVVAVQPAKFSAYLAGDVSAEGGLSLDLSATLNAALGTNVQGVMWEPQAGQMLPQGVTLSQGGTLSVAQSNQVQTALLVTAKYGSDQSATGVVWVNAMKVQPGPVLALAVGQSGGLSLDLNELGTETLLLPGTRAADRIWSLASAQNPTWLSVSSSGVFSAVPPTGTVLEAGSLVVEVFDSTQYDLPRTYISIGLKPASFTTTVLAGFANSPDGLSLDLNSLLPASAGLSGAVTWTKVASGTLAASTLTAVGTLSLQGGMTMASRELVNVTATDAQGKTATGLVLLKTVGVQAVGALHLVTGGTAESINLSEVLRASAYEQKGSRPWRITPGQVLPSWLKLDAEGVVFSGQPPAGTVEPARTVFFESYDPNQGGPAGTKTYLSVTVELVDFTASLVRSVAQGQGAPEAYSLDLSLSLPSPSGLTGALTWSIPASSEALAGSARLTTAGVLSIPAGAPTSLGFEVDVRDSSQNGLLGWVSVNVVDPAFSTQIGVQPGLSVASSFDLNLLGSTNSTLPGSAETRVWSFREGQTIPSWLTLSNRGLLAAKPPAGVTPAVSEYVVQVDDPAALNPLTARRYGSVSLQSVAFSKSIVADSEAASPTSLDLNTLVPAGTNLGEGVVWSLLTPGSLNVSVSPQGQMSVASGMQGSQQLLFKAQGTGGAALVGAVSVRRLSVSGSAETNPLEGLTLPTKVDLNALPGFYLNSYGASSRSWSLVSGQALPPWLTVTAGGLLSLKPAAGESPFDVFLEMSDSQMSAGGTSGVSAYRLRVAPVSFGESIYIDLSANMGGSAPGTQVARNLNLLVTGTAFSNVAARIWSLLPTGFTGGNSGEKSLAESGTFSVSGVTQPLSGLDVPVQVDNGTGVKQKGRVALRAGYPMPLSFYGVIGSGSLQTIELAPSVANYLRTPGSSLTWSAIPGAPAPLEGMSIDAAGKLTLPAPTAAMQGTNVLYADLLVTPPAIFGTPYVLSLKVSWVVGNFSVLLAGETGRFGGEISLDLNSFLPSGSAPTGALQWELPTTGMAPSSWSVTSSGTLSLPGAGMYTPSGVLVVQARDEAQKLFLGIVDAQVRNPVFTGSLAVSAGGSATLNLGTLSYSSPQETNKWSLQRGLGVQLEGIVVSRGGSLSVQAPAGTPNGVYRVYPARTTIYTGAATAGGPPQVGRVNVTVTGGTSTLLGEVSTVLGSKVVKVASTTGLTVGTPLSGPGLASGSTVASVQGPTQFTLNVPAVANLVGSTLSADVVILPPFEPPWNLSINSGNLNPILGGTVATSLDLNALPLMASPLSGTKVWSLLPGQKLPVWLALSTTGTLSAAPGGPTTTAPFDAYFQVTDSLQTKYFGKVTVAPVQFGTAAFADLAAASGPVAPAEPLTLVSLNLNSLVTGTDFASVAGRVWSLVSPVEGQSAVVPRGISLSQGGTFQVSSSVNYTSVPTAVLVEVRNEAGLKQRGVVNVRATYATAVSYTSLVVSGTARTENLNNRIYAGPSGATVTWSLTSGVPLPTGGLSINAAGTLTLPDPKVALPGLHVLYADALINNPSNVSMPVQTQTLKVTWAVVNFSAYLKADASLPGGVSLDLNGLFPESTSHTSPLLWALAPGQTIISTQGWTLAEGGTLAFTPTPATGFASGQLVVQAKDGSNKAFAGALNVFVVNPVFSGTLEATAGQTAASFLDVGKLIDPAPAGSYVSWSGIGTGAGVQLSGVSLLQEGGMNTGTLRAQPGPTTAAGTYQYYVQRYVSGGQTNSGGPAVGRVSVVVSGGSSTLLRDVTVLAGSNMAKSSSTSGLAVGAFVTGPGIAPGTTVTHVNSPSQFTLSAPALSTFIGVSLAAGATGSGNPSGFQPPTAIAFSSTARPVTGATDALTLDLNTLLSTSAVLTGDRVWSLVPGQNLPSWVTVGTLGSLAVSVPLGTSLNAADLYVQVVDGAQTKLYGKITLTSLEFGSSLFADLSNTSGATSSNSVVASLDLNPLVTGTAFATGTVRNWALSAVQSSPVATQGITLSAGGTFSVASGVSSSSTPSEVLVEVSNASGAVAKGKVLVRAVYPMSASAASTLGVSLAKTRDLSTLLATTTTIAPPVTTTTGTGTTTTATPVTTTTTTTANTTPVTTTTTAASGTAGSRVWSLTPGAPTPMGGLTLDANGTIYMPAATALNYGSNVLYADAVLTSSTGVKTVSTVKFTWTVYDLVANLLAETSQPGGVNLDLNATLPPGATYSAPLQWALQPEQSATTTAGWTLTSAGSLSFASSALTTFSVPQLLVRATDLRGKVLSGLVRTYVFNPRYTGSVNASIGQTAASTFNLASMTGAVPVGTIVNWSPYPSLPGVPVAGASVVSSTGILSVLPLSGGTAGTYPYYIMRSVSGGTSGTVPQISRVDVTLTGGSYKLLTGVTMVGGSSSLRVASTQGVGVGASIVGDGLAPGTTVTRVDSPTSLTLSIAAQATYVGMAVAVQGTSTFQPPTSLAFAATARPVPGATEAVLVDLNKLLPASTVLGTTRQWSVVAGQSLPTWISVTPAGVLSVQPPLGGALPESGFYVQVTDGGKAQLFGKMTLENPVPTFTSELSVTLVYGLPFTYQLVADGAPTGYIASGLPIGVTLDEKTGLISSGNLAVNFLGPVKVLVGASNSLGTGSGTLTLIGKKAVPVVSSTLEATAVSGVPFSYQIKATNAPTAFSAVGLPPGLSLDAASGLITGVPSSREQTSVVSVTIGAENEGGSGVPAVLALNVLPPLPSITSVLKETATAGKFFTYTISASGAPTAYAVDDLVSGLNFEASMATLSGVISGSLASATPYKVVLTATNGSGSAKATLFLTVGPAAVTVTPFTEALSVTTGDAVKTLRLDPYLGSAQGSTARRAWSFAAGQEALPSWIQLSSSGVLSVLAPLTEVTSARVLNVIGVETGTSAVKTVNGTVTLNVSAAQPPEADLPLVQSPAGKVKLDNKTVTLSVSGSLAAGVGYQWRKDGVRVVGGTSSSLPVVVDGPSKLGVYDVVLTNKVGSSYSKPLVLEPSGVPIKLVSSLQPLTLVQGQAPYTWSDFSVANASDPNLPVAASYTWKRDKQVLAQTVPGARFVFSGTLVSGTYEVTATSAFNSVKSEARVRVFQPVTITKPVVSPGTVNPGKAFELSVEAAGGDPAVSGGSLRYQWSRNGVAIQGETNRTFTAPGLVPADDDKVEFSVRAFVRDEYSRELSRGSSATGRIRVRQPLSSVVVTSSGKDVRKESVQQGAFLNFSAVVSVGTGLASSEELAGMAYQWRKDGVEIGGATYATLNFNAGEFSAGSYDVVVTSAFNSVTSPGLALEVSLPATLVTQPVSKTVNRLSNVRFSVEAKGSAPLVYLWSKDGVPLTDGSLVAGAATAALTLSSVDLENAGEYSVQVSNGIGAPVLSSAATLSVTNSVLITKQPVGLTSVVGEKVEFSVGAEGNGLRYQWRRGGKNIVGATLPTLTLNGVKAADAGEYEVAVISGSVQVASEVVRLEVLVPVGIAVEPVGSVALLPNISGVAPYTLTVGATGSGVFSYQWYRNGVAVQGGTQAALAISPTASEADNARADYHVVVSNSVQIGGASRVLGSATSKAATVALLAPVAIDVDSPQPKAATVDAGTQVVVSVSATGGGTKSYKWERLLAGRWNEILGASSSSLVLTDLLPSDTSSFRVKVSNPRNTVTSAEVVVTVREAEVITVQPRFAPVNPGDTAVCEVVAAKAKNPSYQWYKNNVPVALAQGAVLKLPSASAADAGVYHVVVTHAYGSSVSEATRLTVREMVAITAQPVAPPLIQGGSATLVVKATGTPDLKYRWRKDGVPLTGAASSESYTIAGATDLNSGIYDVVVSNEVGSVASSVVNVSVLSGVVITASPANQTADPGTGVRLSVEATGSPTAGTKALVYQWRKYNTAGVPVPLQDQGGVISGGTSDALLIASADPGSLTTAGSGGKYDVIVSNDVNAATSLPAVVTVNSPPVILRQPVSQVVNPGDAVRFVAEVKGTAPLSYAWYRQRAGETAPGTLVGEARELTISKAQSSVDAGTYRVVVSNTVKWNGQTRPATSLEAQLGFIEALTLPDEEDLAPVGSGNLASIVTPKVISAKLESAVEIPFLIQIPSQQGVSIVYQWRKDGVALADLQGVRSGVNTTRLTLAAVSNQDAGSYDVVISKVSAGAEKSRILSRPTLLTILQPPVITGLSNTLARPGQTVSFVPTVTSSGTGALSYQWERGGKVLSGATSRTLQVEAVADSYTLKATDENGTTQVTAVLSVSDVLSVQPLAPSLSAETRSRVRFEAKASGSPVDGVLRYQWRFNGVPVRGAVRARLELPSVGLSHAGQYDVVVSNNFERVVSSPCVLRVNELRRFLTQPQPSTTVNPGEAIRLTAALNNPEGVTYKWFLGSGRKTQAVSGGTSSTLLIENAKAADAGVYMLVVTTPAGRISSNFAKVNVNLPVTILQSPSSKRVLKPGENLMLSVKASGTGPLAYQWLRNGLPIAGANSPTFLLASVSPADAGDYQAGVTNIASRQPVLSSVATVNVTLPPLITQQPADQKLNQWKGKDNAGGKISETPEESRGQNSTLLLTVEASKDPAADAVLRYQWRRNGVPIPGGTQAVLSRHYMSVFDTGLYDVVVTETLGAVTVGSVVSRQAFVLVHELPVFTVPPVSQTVGLGGEASFRSLTAGTPPLRYAWTKTGSPALLGSAGSLTVSAVGSGDYGEYTLTVTGPTGKTASASVLLSQGTAGAGAAFSRMPSSLVGIERKPLELVATAAAGYKITRWERFVNSGTSLSAEVLQDVQSTGSLRFSSPLKGDSGSYRAISVLQSGSGEAFPSDWVSLYINSDDPLYAPGFRLETGSVNALKNTQVFSTVEDGSATFRMFPVGEGLSYEWRKAGATAPLANSNKTTFTLRNLTKADSGLYFGTVLVPDGVGGVERRDSIEYTLIVQPLPVIGEHPVAQSLLPGQNAVFSIQTDVTPDSRFQWFFQRAGATEWVPVPGATVGSGTLSTCYVRDIREVDEGSYRVEVTNGAGTVSSKSAFLTVRNPVEVRLRSSPGVDGSGVVSLDPRSTLTLSADIGSAVAAEELVGDLANPPVYVFRRQLRTSKKYEILASGTSSVFTIEEVSEKTDDTFYTVTVEGKVNGQVTSAPLRVSVHDPVSFGLNPLKTLPLVAGETATLNVNANGHNPQYQWYRRSDSTAAWQALSGATAATYLIANATQQDAGSYGVVLSNTVTDDAGKPVTAPANGLPLELAKVTVTVPKAPPTAVVLLAAQPLQVVEGGSLSLQADVSDAAGGLVRFQWRRDGRAVEDGTGAFGSVVVSASAPTRLTLLKPAVTPADAGQYGLVVFNANGATFSEQPRLVSVTALPSVALVSRPQAASASVNGTATFRVAATATGVLKYQWQRLLFKPGSVQEWTNVGVDSPVHSVKGVAAAESETDFGDDRSRYRVVLSLPDAGYELPEKPEAELRVSKPTDVKFDRQPSLIVGGSVRGSELSFGLTTARLEAVARETAGGTLISYQWRKDGVPIADARSKASGSVTIGASRTALISYELPAVDNNSDGVYDLLIDNGANFASSEALVLSVNPKILSLDVPSTLNPGDSAKLEVKVSGTGHAYQWRRDGVKLRNTANSISGADSSVLLLSSVTAGTGSLASSGSYSVVVTNASGVSNTSAALPLVVAAKVSINQQPALAGKLKTGQTLALSVQASGGGTVLYQWFKDGSALDSATSATSATLNVPSVTLAHAGLYQVRVSNASGSLMSNLVSVGILQPLSATLAPSLEVDLGQTANLVPTLAGEGTLSYQWLLNGVEIPGATSEQYRINPAKAVDAGSYTLRLTSKQTAETAETVTSAPLVLKVKLLPQIVVPPASLTVGGAVSTASFAVVVRSLLPVTYAWTRGGEPVGGNSPYLNLTGLSAAGASLVNVTVSNSQGSVSATAKLTVGATSPKAQNAGSTAASQVYSYASWWVFWADALGATKGEVYTSGSTKSGYWLIERLSAGTGSSREVTPGRALWVWGDSEVQSEAAFMETWEASRQSVQDAMDSQSAEFSVLAQMNDSNYALSGRVEPSGEASLYGAPAAMEGAYENAAFGRLDLSLVWDGEQVLYFDGNSNIEAVKSQLEKVLASELVKINGE